MISGHKLLFSLVVLVACIFSSPAPAQTETSPDPVALIEALEQPTERVEFREEHHDPLLASRLVSRGYLSRDEAGNLTKQTVFPRQEVVVITDDRIELQRNGNERSFNPNQRPAMAGLFTSLRALVGGDADSLMQHFTAAAETTDKGWTINLTPRDEALLKRLEKIEVHGHERRIRAIHTHMQDGSWQRLILKEDAAAAAEPEPAAKPQ